MKTRNIVSIFLGLVAGLGAQVGWGQVQAPVCGGMSASIGEQQISSSGAIIYNYHPTFDTITHVAVDTFISGATQLALQIVGTYANGSPYKIRLVSTDSTNVNWRTNLLECAKAARMVMLAPGTFALYVWVSRGIPVAEGILSPRCNSASEWSYCALIPQTPKAP